jgi:hypothetical protein
MRISRNQTAIYWAPDGVDSFGQPTFTDLVEIACRWENKNEVFIDKTAREARSTAVIYPDQELQEEGMLFLGTLDDLSSGQENDPRSIADAGEIKAVGSSPNLKATSLFYKAWI